ncbi:cadmium resistance transporter [Lactovum miscens]|uniref:Cadmium resistance transport/sequestration family protein n=1 Tax=Lactovum miscens TaxID=190387 RepID=A0A841C6L8_9LACT|nr:cadmium resistance transporter [Lactovum miscens]MBB5887242.1 cadmium resistance transport/sequestration family protein [Lactovum miscens]
MISIILQATLIYWATALDLLLILAILFCGNHRQEFSSIALGQILGSSGLIIVSLIFAFVLGFVPKQWLLGLLGLIPIAFGLKYLIKGDDEEKEIAEALEKRRNKNMIWTVALLSFASCGADNIGLFTPFFVTLSRTALLVAVLTMFVNIIFLGLIGRALSRIEALRAFLGNYSRWIMAVIYIGIGIMVLIEAGTLSKVISFL